ncbi:DUF397 domain-containing protein [Halostreptopolyspora alba]|uniref:DUF397 domain-containing protein n=1 Tax=Halostreptopolyspora alba TaxID=2487137 RepID=A0A3N0E1H4_9ACTN|nr:DUF397 domain-containing protein [Nocardiopsaceae bacterium YIM 96095]
MAKTRHWYKSSYSGGSNNNCVEVSDSENHDVVGVRDTQNRRLGHIDFTRSAWDAFLRDLKADQF